MNILFYLIPKAKVEFIKDTFTLRQAVEKMDECGYAAIPIINDKGEYVETITNGEVQKSNTITVTPTFNEKLFSKSKL